MDNSDDKIFKLIGFDASESDKNEASNYLQKLRTLKKENLVKETHNLKDDLNNLELHQQEIAFANYPAFIQTAESSRQVLKGWNETAKNVDKMIEKLPQFTNVDCNSFVKSSFEMTNAARLNSITMKRQVELLEILELPQLMEKSITEEHYEDALELAAYVQKIGTKFENIPLVNNVVKTIESSWHVMITQLLQELKSDLTLPKCLQLIGYLRRMQAFSSSELKLKFLQARDCWFKETLSVIPKTNVQQHLTRTIEVTRINLFNIVTQYKALFNEDFSMEDNTTINLIFSSWMHEKIDEFLKVLQSDLDQWNASLMDISSILAQCMYFGVSFSKIGFDFRARLTPIFIKNITKYITTSIVKITKQLEMEMESFTLINKDIGSFKRHLNNENVEKSENAPPENLLEFNPLAIYCNSLINILNELRICSPTAIAQVFVVAVEVSMENVAKSILSFYRSEHQVFGVKEKENFMKMCTCFAFELLPYIQHCIDLIFPPNNKFAQNIESITCLKSKKILEPIENFLPEVKT